MSTYTIKCVTCYRNETFQINIKNTKSRKYCTRCAKIRKKTQIDFSNREYVPNGNPLGRPRHDIEYGVMDLKNVFTYDGSNELGY